MKQIAAVAIALSVFALSACSSSSSTTITSMHTQQLFVSDSGANALYVFSLAATGAAAAAQSIHGAATGLSNPFGVAVDNAGNIYVANEGNSSVTEYAAGATGNVAPIKTITSSASFADIRGIAVDSAGNIYVSDTTARAVWIFTAAQAGNVVPTAMIQGASTTLSFPGGVAVDTSGKVYVGDQGDSAILEWTAGHTGNVAPDNTITGVTGAYTLQIVNGNITIGGQNGGHIFVFPTSASGAAVPTQHITGAATTLGVSTRGAAMDATGAIWAANGSVAKFAPGVTGNVAPVTTLTVPVGSEALAVF
jgi:sugar lactone lactonase YvrE